MKIIKVREEYMLPVICAITGVSIFLFGMWFGRTQLSKFIPNERVPRAGNVYACYNDSRDDSYALTNGFPSESVTITKIVRIKDKVAYSATWTANISRLEGYGNADFNLYGPVSNYVNYPKYYTLLKPR